MGRKALPLQMNVMDLPQAYGAVDRMIDAWGKIDILVNNVGGGTEGPVEDFPEADFDLTINLNVKSTFFISQYVGRHMIGRKSGAIVNMGSQAGAIALPGEAIYCLSKAAVSHMTKCFAVEWGKHNVRVNCVGPTFIRTDGTAAALSDPEFKADVVERIAALHRIGEPKEVSGAVVFLASDAASLITGQTLLIDGGWTAR
jgi:NAD(P)-dependent dehydrogenase (short-subunit alcohol dehydrogenase family)